VGEEGLCPCQSKQWRRKWWPMSGGRVVEGRERGLMGPNVCASDYYYT